MTASVLVEAHNAIAVGEYMAAVRLLEGQDKNNPKVLSLYGQALFFSGRYEDAYYIYNRLFHEESVKREEIDGDFNQYDPMGQDILESLNKLGIPKMRSMLPVIMDLNYPQSKEDVNEFYPETLKLQKMLDEYLKKTNNDQAKAMKLALDTIEQMESSTDRVTAALGWFYQGEINFRMQRYKDAYQSYLKAATTEISKALYYGYAANMLMKEAKKDPSVLGIASILTYRAIELDFENAKWHYNEGMILMSLAKLFGKNEVENQSILKAAKKELATAFKLCPVDNYKLKHSIELTYDEIRKAIY